MFDQAEHENNNSGTIRSIIIWPHREGGTIKKNFLKYLVKFSLLQSSEEARSNGKEGGLVERQSGNYKHFLKQGKDGIESQRLNGKDLCSTTKKAASALGMVSISWDTRCCVIKILRKSAR